MITIKDTNKIMSDFIKNVMFSCTDRSMQEQAFEILTQSAIEKAFSEGRIGGFAVDPQVRADIIAALRDREKIRAIKIFRGATEVQNLDGSLSNLTTLAQAKIIIEQFAQDLDISI